MPHNLDTATWVATLGYIGILGIIFFETAIFIGFFLPGDSLLFTAGYLAAKGVFKLSILIPSIAAVAFIGYTVAYWLGIRLGHWLMKCEDRFWFKKKYLINAHGFYQNHGGKALLLGRLVPVLRTFIPIAAGMADMNYRRFTLYNLVGAVIWAVSLPVAGYYIGTWLPDSNIYILPCVLVVVLISSSPAFYEWWKHKQKMKKPQ